MLAKKIPIKGSIVKSDSKWIYDWLGIEATSPGDVSKALAEANGDEVEVEINSGGGDIFSGSEIYTALRSYKGKVKINIVGIAASAASVIAMAGESNISPTAMFMIHNVSTTTSGDRNAHEHSFDTLAEADRAIANAYKEKTGLSENQLLSIMDAETYMSAETAVKNKFVDGIMFQNQKASLYNSTQSISETAINKLRNLIRSPGAESGPDISRSKAEAKMKLIKLGGQIK